MGRTVHGILRLSLTKFVLFHSAATEGWGSFSRKIRGDDLAEDVLALQVAALTGFTPDYDSIKFVRKIRTREEDGSVLSREFYLIDQDIKFLAYLKQRGEIVHITNLVDMEFEIPEEVKIIISCQKSIILESGKGQRTYNINLKLEELETNIKTEQQTVNITTADMIQNFTTEFISNEEDLTIRPVVHLDVPKPKIKTQVKTKDMKKLVEQKGEQIVILAEPKAIKVEVPPAVIKGTSKKIKRDEQKFGTQRPPSTMDFLKEVKDEFVKELKNSINYKRKRF